ncbi:hypothetical protein HQ590_10255 [bacterium]|nr:hypothetical protein [bacterium]
MSNPLSCRAVSLLTALLLVAVPGVAGAAVRCSLGNAEFLRPLQGPAVVPDRFQISVPVRFSAPVSGRITGATLNDKSVLGPTGGLPLFETLSADGKHLGGEKFEGARNLIAQFPVGWITGESYQLSVTVTLADGQVLNAVTPTVMAPAGGRFRPDIPQFFVIVVRETAGRERKSWPVLASALLGAHLVGDPAADLLLLRRDRAAADGYAVVPFQVLDVVEAEYVAENAPAAEKNTGPYRQQRVDVCFLADIPAGGSNQYYLCYGKRGIAQAAPGHQPELRYAGDGLGVTVDTGPVRFAFDPKSGQLLSYAHRIGDTNAICGFVQYEPRPCHWNPDVWAPPSPWGHTSDWGTRDFPPPELEVRRGPLVYRSVRRGTMPWANGVRAEVRYTLFAGSPVILESSTMEFTAGTDVRAVRNNELVFSRGIHTHTAWAGEEGKINTRRLYDPQDPFKFFGRVMETGPDVPWVALYHEQNRNGIAVVNLARHTRSGGFGAPPDRGARYYALDYGQWGPKPGKFEMNFAYICRSLVRGPMIVSQGTVFGEDSAFLVFQTGRRQRQFTDLQRWAEMLRHPLVVEVH